MVALVESLGDNKQHLGLDHGVDRWRLNTLGEELADLAGSEQLDGEASSWSRVRSISFTPSLAMVALVAWLYSWLQTLLMSS